MTERDLSTEGAASAAPSPLRVLVLQQQAWGSPASEDVEANAERLVQWVDAEIARRPCDVAVLPELSTTPYFCCSRNDRYFEWARPIPGPITDRFAEVAKRHETTLIVPMYERGADGNTYNSAAVLGADGELVPGYTGERRFDVYRKCHVPSIVNPPDTEAWEDYYFRPGAGLPVFQTSKVRFGMLICYDRWFPEAWRMLAAQGAQLVLVPMVAWGFVEGPYLYMLRSRAVENGLFVASCNRAGVEVVDGVSMDNFGRSAVIAPDGRIDAIAEPGETEKVLYAELDLGEIERQRRILPLLRHRRTDIYGEPLSWTPA